MTQPERDDDFEAFLKHRTVLPHGMPVDDKLEPPGALDAIVLKKASEALDARTRSQRVPRWAKPVAIAATILLCLSVVLNISLNTNHPEMQHAQLSTATAPPPPPAPTDAATDNPAYRESSAGASNATTESVLAKAATGAPADRTVAEAATGTSAPRATDAASTSADSRSITVTGRRAAAPPALARDNSAEQRREKADDTLSDVIVSRNDKLASVSAPVLAEPESQAAPMAPVPSAGAPIPSPAPAPSLDIRSETSIARTDQPPPPAESNPQYSAPEEVVLTSTHGPAKRKDAPPAHPKDPKAWLRQIDALRSRGKTAAAEAEMQRFRAAFPDYPVPPADPPK